MPGPGTIFVAAGLIPADAFSRTLDSWGGARCQQNRNWITRFLSNGYGVKDAHSRFDALLLQADPDPIPREATTVRAVQFKHRTEEQIRECLDTCLVCTHSPKRNRASFGVICAHARCHCGADTPLVQIGNTPVSRSLAKRMQLGLPCPAGKWGSTREEAEE